MNTTRSHPPVHPEATFRQAGLDELVRDVSRLGPAPNVSRELFATVVNLAIVGIALAVLQPSPVVGAAVGAAVAVFVMVRWTVGSRTWGHR